MVGSFTYDNIKYKIDELKKVSDEKLYIDDMKYDTTWINIAQLKILSSGLFINLDSKPNLINKKGWIKIENLINIIRKIN